MGFQLTASQRLAVENAGGPLLVSAAAGAGKTRVLVERLLDRVAQGADIDHFLVITFTNDAAAELRGRVIQALGERLAQTPGDRHLRRQLTLVYGAHISTIHAFCGGVLREWGHLLDVDPDYRLVDQGEGELLKRETLEDLLEKRYRDAEDDPAFRLLLDTFSAGRDDKALMDMVLEVYDKLQSHPDPADWIARTRRTLAENLTGDCAGTPWGGYLLDKYRRRAGYWWEKLAGCYQACQSGVRAYLESLSVTLEGLDRLRRVARWDDAQEVLFPRLSPVGKSDDRTLAETVKRLRERCRKEMDKLWEALGQKSNALLRDMRDTTPASDALLALVAEFSDAYDKRKSRRGLLDFNDLEHKTLDLLRRHPQVARAVSEQFQEVMVDEYQDTNQAQNAIFQLLTQERGNLFMVGDVKQSIYRFRLADPTLFLEKYRAYPNCPEAQPGQGRRVVLGENFRSRREVIESVNFLFANLMSRELGELDYGPDEALRAGGTFPPPEGDYRPELYLIANPKVTDEGDEGMVEPRFVARRLAQLLAQGFPVSDGQGGTRPVEPSDMAILLRAPNRVLRRYAGALGEAGIPWESEDSDDFFDAPETAVALSFLEIIDNPRQDVPLIGVLRSPLYRFTPDRLSQLKPREEGKCFYDVLCRDEGEDAQAFLRELSELRFLAGDLRGWELIWELYRRTGLLSVYAAMPDGEARREHLLALYEYAKRYEGAGHRGLFGFLTHLRRRREQGEALTAPGGKGGGGVRILSIHKSKGLEFPVVVVAGLAKNFNRRDTYAPMLFHQELGLGPRGLDLERRIQYPTLARWAVGAKLEEESLSEELRLLYVALTRAREKLIMTVAVKDPAKEVERLIDDAALPPDPQALTAQNSVGQWVLTAALCRPEAEALRFGAPLPGLMDWSNQGGPWRMELLDGEDLRAPLHARGEVTDPEGPRREVDIPDYRWRYPWETAVDVPSKLTATQLKGREMDREAAENAAPAPRSVLFDRPHFALEAKGLTPGERGTAHHLVMQYLDFRRAGSVEAVGEEIQRMVERQIITPQQGAAVDPAVIFAFFQSPLGREAMASGALHREFKFSVLEEARRYYPQLPPGETVLLQGVVDCWYETEAGLVVIDFKSDHVTAETVEARAEEYQPQLDGYSRALSLMLERPVARRVLWFFALSRAVEI